MHLSLTTWYDECLRWLHKAGLSIKKTEVIFYSPAKPHPDTHGFHPASLTIPTADSDMLTIQSKDNVRHLSLYINHKLNWYQHVNIMVTWTCGILKALQLLGNSIRGLDHGN